MEKSLYSNLESPIVRDRFFLFTLFSYIMVLLIFANLYSFQSSLIGLVASIIYFVINGVFLGNTFFWKETAFFRLTLGILLLIMLVGFVGWLSVIIYNLDVAMLTLVLLVTATISSLLNKRMRIKRDK